MHRGTVRQLADFLTRHRDEVLAVVRELDARDELRVAEHGGHALAGVVVVDGHRLVRAGGRRVDAAAVERHLDQRAVVAVRALERSVRKIDSEVGTK